MDSAIRDSYKHAAFGFMGVSAVIKLTTAILKLGKGSRKVVL